MSCLKGNELYFEKASDGDTGIYTCYLDNFVQPVVSYKFSLMVEGDALEIYIFLMLFSEEVYVTYISNYYFSTSSH